MVFFGYIKRFLALLGMTAASSGEMGCASAAAAPPLKRTYILQARVIPSEARNLNIQAQHSVALLRDTQQRYVVTRSNAMLRHAVAHRAITVEIFFLIINFNFNIV